MTNQSDKPTTPRGPSRFLSTLRDVIFEQSATPDAAPYVAAPDVAIDAEKQAALAALRERLELGPGASEFALQMEALAEALPSAALRQSAALHVLARKGVSTAALSQELEATLRSLASQREAFTQKVAERHHSIAQRRANAEASYASAAHATEEEVRRLEQALVQARASLAEAATLKQGAEGECDADFARLAVKQSAFDAAFSQLNDEYVELKQRLSSAPERA